MTTKTVPITQSVRFGWETFKNNVGFLIGIFLTVTFISIFLEVASRLGEELGGFFGFVVWVGYVLASSVIQMGLIKVTLRFMDGSKPEFEDLFNTISLVFKFIAASILYFLMILLGFMLFIVPGIYLTIRFQFYSYFIVDDGVGPIEALRRSSQITSGVKMDLFAFALLLFVINCLGAFLFMIGLYVSMPVTALALAFVYRKLQSPRESQRAQILPQAG
jgi:uncharacterized membrane protein